MKKSWWTSKGFSFSQTIPVRKSKLHCCYSNGTGPAMVKKDRKFLPSGICSINQSCFAQKWITWQRLRVFPVPFSPSNVLLVKENITRGDTFTLNITLTFLLSAHEGRKHWFKMTQAGRKGYREDSVQLDEQNWCFSGNAEALGLVFVSSGKLHQMFSPMKTGQQEGEGGL